MQEAAMNSASVTVSDSPTPGNLFDEFEEAFQNCLAPLTKEDPLNGINQEELKVNAETNGQRFLDLAHRMEAFFLQKRLLLSVQKPEALILEENGDIKLEIIRKDELIKKETEKLAEWQNTLMTLIARVGSVPSSYSTRSPNIAPQTPGPLPLSHSPMMSGGQSASGQCTMQQINTSSSNMGIVGGMNHGPSHNISSGSTVSHQTMMGQVGSGGSSMSGITSSGYQQQINNMGSSGNPLHSGNIGGGPTTMGSMSGTQGPISVGMGSGMSISRSQGPVSTSGGMYHGNAGAGPPMAQTQGGLQGPLAYLEKTTTNIGMPETRR